MFISSEKLSQAVKMFDQNETEAFEPIPSEKLGNQVVFIDGRTRVFAMFLRGFTEIDVC